MVSSTVLMAAMNSTAVCTSYILIEFQSHCHVVCGSIATVTLDHVEYTSAIGPVSERIALCLYIVCKLSN